MAIYGKDKLFMSLCHTKIDRVYFYHGKLDSSLRYLDKLTNSVETYTHTNTHTFCMSE